MSSSLTQLLLAGTILAAIQVVAALPWLYALDPQAFRAQVRRGQSWAILLAVVLVGGAGLSWLMSFRNDPAQLEFSGRVYGSLLHAQLAIDILLAVLGLFLMFWPRGGTVAMAAFREGYR